MRYLQILLAVIVGTRSTHATSDGLPGLGDFRSPEASHSRQVYYVGGDYRKNGATTSYTGQMYVEQLIPAKGVKRPNPLVFFHGGGLTGVTWLQTPDNRKGWASYFLDEGYAVYLVDVTSVGRAGRPSSVGVRDSAPAEVVETFFTASQFHPDTYPQAKLHTQWPDDGRIRSPSFNAFYPTFVQVPSDNVATQYAVQDATCKLLAKIGSSFLITHSYGGLFPWSIADKCPSLVQGIYGVEPDTPPFASYATGKVIPTRVWGITDIPLTYSPAVTDPIAQLNGSTVSVGQDSPGNHSCLLQKSPARKLPNLAKIPIYFYTTDSSIHVTYDHCLAKYLWQAGVPAEWQLLADIGIRGNGHFSFVEKNNLQLAKLANEWFKKHSGKRGKKARRT